MEGLFKVVKLRPFESRTVVAKGWGKGGNGELLFSRSRVSVLQDEKVLESGLTSNGNVFTTGLYT